MATIHTTVTGTASQPRSQYRSLENTLGLETISITFPDRAATSAAMICTTNLNMARRE